MSVSPGWIGCACGMVSLGSALCPGVRTGPGRSATSSGRGEPGAGDLRQIVAFGQAEDADDRATRRGRPAVQICAGCKAPVNMNLP